MTTPIKITTEEVRELIKHAIQLHITVYQHANPILEKNYANLHKTLSSYLKEIKDWSSLKFGDAKAFSKFYIFLPNGQSISESQECNDRMKLPEKQVIGMEALCKEGLCTIS